MVAIARPSMCGTLGCETPLMVVVGNDFGSW
jgi:hypothetical protein